MLKHCSLKILIYKFNIVMFLCVSAIVAMLKIEK